MSSKVTVCIPVYNGEKYLAECLDSVITQTHWDLDILIVDDQSTDNSMAIVEEYAQLDDRIIIHRNEENLGLVGNWNKALELAKTDLIKYVFQDDIIYPQCIAKMLEAMESFDCPIAACARGFVIEANASKNIREYFQKKIIKPDHFFKNTDYISAKRFGEVAARFPLANLVGEPSVLLFRKSALEKVGLFDDLFSQFVDFEFALRLISEYGFVFVPDILAYFRVHGGAQSDKNTSKDRSEEKFFKVEYIDNLVFLSKVLEDDSFKNYREKLEGQTYKNKFRAIMMNFLNEFGEEKVVEVLSPYYEKAKGLKERVARNIKFYNREYFFSAFSNTKENKENAIVWIDELNEKSYNKDNGQIEVDNELITLKGWAIDKITNKVASAVYVTVDDQDFSTLYGHKREDIAIHFQNEKLENCGFYTRIPKSKLSTGKHLLSFKVISAEGTDWHGSETSIEINVK